MTTAVALARRYGIEAANELEELHGPLDVAFSMGVIDGQRHDAGPAVRAYLAGMTARLNQIAAEEVAR